MSELVKCKDKLPGEEVVGDILEPTREQLSFIVIEPEKYPVFSWVYEWLNILTFEKFLLII